MQSRRRMRWLQWLLGGLVSVAMFGACGGGEFAPIADAQLELGRSVFDARCASCHGSRGQGVIGPKLGGGQVVKRYPDVADQRSVIENGRSAMPKFSSVLSSDEIDAVVRYTRESLGR